jgi:iron(III) transport system ATP-binding protein
MSAIGVAGLTLRRAGGFTLGPLDLELAAGSATAVVGPSGCGKTTLLRCLAGLEQPTAGRVVLGGATVRGPQHVGFVFPNGALWPHLTALQHLAFVAPRRARAELLALLAQVGLQDKAQRRPGELSSGEGQRLALARALAGDPQVLLLDEPLRSVDVHLRDALALLVRKLARARGLTLVLVTHDRDEALAMADDLVVLRAGRVVERGTAASVLAEPRTAFAAAFLGRAACLPALPAPGGYGCAFGEVAAAPHANGAMVLALLPGDVEALPAGGSAVLTRPVLHVEATADGALAAVEIDGQTVRVACGWRPAPGELLALRLRRPRFLPAGGDA